MPYLVKNNRLFIDIPNQPNQVGLDLHSQSSHVCRKILKVVFNVFCCLWLCHKKDSTKVFSFETFEAKVDGKIFYLRKEQYFKLKKAYQPDEKYLPNFAEDFIKTIRGNVVNLPLKLLELTPKLDQPDFENNGKKEEAALNQVEKMEKKEVIDPIKEAEDLLNFLIIWQSPDEKWIKFLTNVKKEVFEKAVQNLDNQLETSYENYKKLYLLANHDQRESLLQNLTYPEYFSGCFPDDVNLHEKVAEILFKDPNRVKTFFESIDKRYYFKDIPINNFIPLAEQLLSKFPQNLQELSNAAKNNAFGFDLNPALENIFKKGMINLIFKEFSWVEAETILLPYIFQIENFNNEFGLKMLVHAIKELNPENEQQIISERMIQFAFKFLIELNIASPTKCRDFIEKLPSYSDGMFGALSNHLTTIIDCFIIGALRSPNAEEILNLLYQNTDVPLLKPSKETLEANLTDEQHQKFINWAEHRFAERV